MAEQPSTNTPTEWACKVGDRYVRLSDLPISDLGRIAKDAEMVSWTVLVQHPLLDAGAAEALMRHCYQLEGETPPDPITGRVVVDAFERIAEDLPTTFEGGLPKEGPDPTTPGS